jgi:galactokinase
MLVSFMIDQLLLKWKHVFGPSIPEVIVRAPGRVNIIGEHTDYNEGWVLPGAMSRSIYILLSKNKNRINHWIADNLDETFDFDAEQRDKLLFPLWAKYVDGTIRLFLDEPVAFNIIIGGDLPVGAGVSSSSSLVCGLLVALHSLSRRRESKEELALIGSRVEREIIGLQGGIMDQFAVMLSKEKAVMMLDCRTYKYQFIPAGLSGCRWILINTKVKHQLVDSDYNNRADECKQAVVLIQKKFPAVQSLRDVTLEILSSLSLPDVLQRRSLFVIEENIRVHDMVESLLNLDADHAGELLMASHAGLRDQYEVSCDELNHLADFANNYAGVYGARMMGGGFGGCVICLVRNENADSFLSAAVNSYRVKFGFNPEVIDFELADGVEVLP